MNMSALFKPTVVFSLVYGGYERPSRLEANPIVHLIVANSLRGTDIWRHEFTDLSYITNDFLFWLEELKQPARLRMPFDQLLAILSLVPK
jgi:hypothetical protein